MKGCSFYKDH